MEAQGKTDTLGAEIDEKSQQSIIPDFAIDSLARCLLPALQAYYKDPAGQVAFEDWKRQQNQNT